MQPLAARAHTLLTGAEGAEVLGRLGHELAEELYLLAPPAQRISDRLPCTQLATASLAAPQAMSPRCRPRLHYRLLTLCPAAY